MENKINYKLAILQQLLDKIMWILFLSFSLGIATSVFIGSLWIKFIKNNLGGIDFLKIYLISVLITLLVLIFFYAVSFLLSIKNFSFYLEDTFIKIRRGVFGNTEIILPYSDIRVLNIKKGLGISSYKIQIEFHGIYRSEELNTLLLGAKKIQVIKEQIYGLSKDDAEKLKKTILNKIDPATRKILDNQNNNISPEESLKYELYSKKLKANRLLAIKQGLFINAIGFIAFIIGIYLLKNISHPILLGGYNIGLIIIVSCIVFTFLFIHIITLKTEYNWNGVFPLTINGENNMTQFFRFRFSYFSYRLSLEETFALLFSMCTMYYFSVRDISVFLPIIIGLVIIIILLLILLPLAKITRKNYFLDSPETKKLTKINFFVFFYFITHFLFWGGCLFFAGLI